MYLYIHQLCMYLGDFISFTRIFQLCFVYTSSVSYITASIICWSWSIVSIHPLILVPIVSNLSVLSDSALQFRLGLSHNAMLDYIVLDLLYFCLTGIIITKLFDWQATSWPSAAFGATRHLRSAGWPDTKMLVSTRSYVRCHPLLTFYEPTRCRVGATTCLRSELGRCH